LKVLITGITGCVGSHMADYLLDKAEIIGLKRWRSPMDNVKHLIGKVKFYDGDLKDLSSMIDLIRTEKPDCIFHFGAQSLVPISFTMPNETIQDNVIGTLNLLEAIRFNQPNYWNEDFNYYNPTIVIASSSEVYGQVSKEDIPIKETCPLRPMSPYAVSKVAEDMLGYQYFQSYGMKIIRTRLFTHTGKRRFETFHESSFAKQIVMIEKGAPLVIKVGNLDSVRTYLDVRDAVRAYWMVKDCPAGEVYNIGGDFTCTVGDTLNYLIGLSTYKGKIDIQVEESLLRPSDVTLQIPCIDKFTEATNWSPQIPFQDTLRSLLDYWRERI
jgi:GDP-mannose 4,6-dehydratase